MRRLPTAFCAVLLSLVCTAASAGPSVVEAGRVLSYQACAACHQVIPKQKRPAPVFDSDANEQVPAPTFGEIAAKRRSEAYLRRAITLPIHPMREQSWSKKDLDAVIAYLKSLEKRSKP